MSKAKSNAPSDNFRFEIKSFRKAQNLKLKSMQNPRISQDCIKESPISFDSASRHIKNMPNAKTTSSILLEMPDYNIPLPHPFISNRKPSGKKHRLVISFDPSTPKTQEKVAFIDLFPAFDNQYLETTALKSKTISTTNRINKYIECSQRTKSAFNSKYPTINKGNFRKINGTKDLPYKKNPTSKTN